MPKHGKRYRALLEKVDPNKIYTIDEAAHLVKELATAKFDETVEVHAKLGIDPRRSDQNVRGTVSLPHGLGKQVRVLAIAKDPQGYFLWYQVRSEERRVGKECSS